MIYEMEQSAYFPRLPLRILLSPQPSSLGPKKLKADRYKPQFSPKRAPDVK
jgi:hypothetical protein